MTAFRGLHGIPPTPSHRDASRLRRWRRAQLMAAGYDELSAHRLAARVGLDLHSLLYGRESAAQKRRAASAPGLRGRDHG